MRSNWTLAYSFGNLRGANDKETVMLGSAFFIATAVATSALETRYVDVQVGTVTLRVPTPIGYCVPKGDRVARYAKLAAPDQKNITLLSLSDCRRNTATNRYLLIKTPIDALDVPFDRTEFLTELAEAVREPEFDDKMKTIAKEVGADKSKATGVPTKMVMQYAPRGRDAVCVYMGGKAATTKQGEIQNQVVGTCMTVIGGRFVALHSYEDTNDPQAYRRLLPRLKQWALQIKPVSP